MRKIQIGTAHFGNVYGLTNNPKPLKAKECWRILDLAIANGIHDVDTSPEYGQSLSILSDFRGGALNITSKIKIKGLGTDAAKRLIEIQRKKLGPMHALTGILVHDFSSLDEYELETFSFLMNQESTISFGVSIYDYWELIKAMPLMDNRGIVQFPINILNQGFIQYLNSASRPNLKFIGRSLLLQGALDWENNRNPFRTHADILRIQDLANTLGINLIELVVLFAKQLAADVLLLGFASELQLKDFLRIWNSNLDIYVDFKNYASKDTYLIDPRLW